uniref:Uncharacterized protein n=1 Tax=Amphimedon queenslandica TaxID=400682 RepID=A0A1X7V613_AMPQE
NTIFDDDDNEGTEIAVATNESEIGNLPLKTFQFLKYLNYKSISPTTFFKRRKLSLLPAVSTLRERKQSKYFEAKKMCSPLIRGGDRRADSPGFSAMYGSYTTMDLNFNQIVDIALVQ